MAKNRDPIIWLWSYLGGRRTTFKTKIGRLFVLIVFFMILGLILK